MPEALDHRSFAEGALTRLLLRVPASLLAQSDVHRARLQEDSPRIAATTGSATAARPLPGAAPRPPGAPRRCAQRPAWPGLCPSPFSGRRQPQSQRLGGRCQGRASAERSEGSLDRKSPPSRYTLVPPGRAGIFSLLGAPGGGRERWRPPQHSASRPRLKREEGDPPYAQRAAAKPPARGAGG